MASRPRPGSEPPANGPTTAGTRPVVGASPAADVSPAPRPGLVRQGDRDKAYRPLAEPERRAALEAGLALYARGEYFEAHEALEPAWMGTDDLAERALHQGLIKVAAAYVHAGRGNPAGVAKNLEGARRHLALAGPAAPRYGIDLGPLVADVEARLADPASIAPAPVIRRIPRP